MPRPKKTKKEYETVSINVSKELLAYFDVYIELGFFKNRSAAFRQGLAWYFKNIDDLLDFDFKKMIKKIKSKKSK